MAKITFISDTHRYHGVLSQMGGGDIILHSGDATGRGTIEEVTKFAKWYGELDFAHRIFIPGNHDWLFEENEPLAREIMKDSGVTLLIDEEVTALGLRIYGSPWQPEFCNWAFNLTRGDEIAEKWNLIPEGIDILVTHGPPMGILDVVHPYDTDLLGCYDLKQAIYRVKPKIHLFGHIHDSYGMHDDGTTKFINASICNERYDPVNKPIVLDV